MKKFSNTSEIEPKDNIIGQDRAVKAMRLGLNDDTAYNIYVCGQPGSGRTSYTIKAIESKEIKTDRIKDWCYVNNFKNSREPIAIDFPMGKGKEFKEDMQNLIEDIFEDLNDAFENEEYELTKNKLVQTYEMEKEKLLKIVKDYAKQKGFKLKNSSSSFIFVPVNDDYEEDTTSAEFYRTKKELEEMTIQILYKIRAIEDKVKKVIIQTEEEIGQTVVNPFIERLKLKYNYNNTILEYLEDVKEDILEYIFLFYLEDDGASEKYDKTHLIKYEVNLITPHTPELDKPVIVLENNPKPMNLIGKAEYEYQNGNLKTDFTKIIPGAFHKANGGYLILYAEQILKYPYSWELLKRTLQNNNIELEGQGFINPRPIPLDVKVILIGTSYIYDLLYTYDSEFMKYFKVLVDFDDEMDKTEENENDICGFIAYQCAKNNYKHLTYNAVEQIINQSMKYVEDKTKLSTNFNRILEIISEANIYATMDKSEFIDEYYIRKAIEEKKQRINKIECKIDSMLERKYTLIETKGSRVGVINGLSVLSTGEHSFGKPSRITVTTGCGSRGIINIEREAKMSGSIHNKGVLILEGYLLETFAQEFPLSLNAYICFEQNYGGIDGDSASSAELYAILSSLSEIGIKQNIAVTGSINQKGEIQVVGGVTKKIEGFYYCCKNNGFAGDEGVIIPAKNEDNLVLCEEIQEAIRNNKFKIYKVNKIEEAMEILTGTKFEEIKRLAFKKLKKYSDYKISKD